ncbi:MAG: hypothetical protein HRU00_11115 [Myxococcales bacterium]|nr:hypothetical protein [Myxococcales bacterium]
MNELYQRYRGRVQFWCVYIQEAHPEDGWRLRMNVDEGIVFKQPRTDGERAEVARACVLGLKLEMPMLLDEITNSVDEAYSALPERLFVLEAGGRIAWRSEQGPWGFDVDAFEKAIGAQLGAED